MTRGKREAARGGRQRGMGDPFAEEAPSKKTGSKRSKKWNWLGGLIIGYLVFIGVAMFLVWNFFIKKPDVAYNNKPIVTNNNPTALGSGSTPASSDGTDTLDAPDGRKEDYYTFLLLGRDTGGGGNTDTIILVSYDVADQQVNMMSIPRDTAVNVSWSTKKINSVYNAKEASGGGIENLKQQVAYLTGVLPDFYVSIEWKAVGRIVEAVGGVEFDVPRNMNYDDPYQDLHIHLNKGVQKLNGQKAMEMLRYRHDNDVNVGYNDTGRMDTQKAFLKAMAKEVLKLKNMTKIGEFIDIFMDNVETDLKLSDLTWFASKALGADTDAIQSSTLPYFDVGTFRGAWYFLPDPEGIVPLVNEQFNPYNRDITVDDLRVIVRRDDGSCYVPNGTLLDSSWGKSYSGSKVISSGGGVSAGHSTGVVASTAPPSGSGSSMDKSQTGNKLDQNTQTADNKPSESGVTMTPNTAAGLGDSEPTLPNPVESGGQMPETGANEPPAITDTDNTGEPPETYPEPEPVPEPVPDPVSEPEPELPPEPILPAGETAMNEAA